MKTNASATTIQPCLEEHVAGVQAIYAHYVASSPATFETEAPTVVEMLSRRTTLLRGGGSYLVALEAGQVIGYAYAGPYRPRAAYRYTVENSVYVADRCRGRGVGRLLLQALVDDCTLRGARQMVAVIGDSANAGSIGLHAALGFRHVGTLQCVGRKFGRWVDTVLMQRELGPQGPLHEADQ